MLGWVVMRVFPGLDGPVLPEIFRNFISKGPFVSTQMRPSGKESASRGRINVHGSAMREVAVPEHDAAGGCGKFDWFPGRPLAKHMPAPSVNVPETTIDLLWILKKITMCRIMAVRPEHKTAALGFHIVQIGCRTDQKRAPSSRAVCVDMTISWWRPCGIQLWPSDDRGAPAAGELTTTHLLDDGRQSRVSTKGRFRRCVVESIYRSYFSRPGIRPLWRGSQCGPDLSAPVLQRALVDKIIQNEVAVCFEKGDLFDA